MYAFSKQYPSILWHQPTCQDKLWCISSHFVVDMLQEHNLETNMEHPPFAFLFLILLGAILSCSSLPVSCSLIYRLHHYVKCPSILPALPEPFKASKTNPTRISRRKRSTYKLAALALTRHRAQLGCLESEAFHPARFTRIPSWVATILCRASRCLRRYTQRGNKPYCALMEAKSFRREHKELTNPQLQRCPKLDAPLQLHLLKCVHALILAK